MPVPQHATAAPAATLHTAIGALRARGVRLSAPRRRLLECLYAPGPPRTAEQLAAAGAGDVATVYRNLGALEVAGVVRHSHRAGGAACWAPAAAVRSRSGQADQAAQAIRRVLDSRAMRALSTANEEPTKASQSCRVPQFASRDRSRYRV